MKKSTILIGVLVVVVMLGILGCSQAKKGQTSKDQSAAKGEDITAVPVTAVAVQPRNMDERVTVTGTLKPAKEVTVGTRTQGRIIWIAGKTGTRVSHGDVVARLDDTDFRTQVKSADAAVEAADARVEQAYAALKQQITSTDTGINSAKAGLKAAEARLEQAKAAAAQQSTSTTSGITTAEANVSAAKARLAQAEASADATADSVNAQVKSSEAALTAAKARLDMLINGARTQEQAVAKNAVDLAQATYDNDKANYDRVKSLYDQKAVSRSTLDAAETKLKISKVQLDSAQQQYALVKEGARPEEVDAAKAAVDQAQEGLASARANLKQVDVAKANVEIARTGVEQANAALDTARAASHIDIMRDKDVLAANAGVLQAQQALVGAESARQVTRMRRSDLQAAQAAQKQAYEARTLALNNLDYAQIVSPVDGVIDEQMVEIGSTVGGNASVLRISTDKSLFFEANISELEATRVQTGQPVQISVDAMQGNRSNLYSTTSKSATITGYLENVVPVVDERSRSFTVRIVVPASKALFPGMFARGEIIVARHPGAVAVPKDALVTKGDHQVVFTVSDNTAHEQIVSAGTSDGGFVQIISGLKAGDQVVTVGQQTLMDGDKVKLRENGNKAVKP